MHFLKITPTLSDIKFINLTGNKRLLMVNEFTFAPTSSKHFYCSQRFKGCKARVFLNIEHTHVMFADQNHNHKPPMYKITDKGFYIKI